MQIFLHYHRESLFYLSSKAILLDFILSMFLYVIQLLSLQNRLWHRCFSSFSALSECIIFLSCRTIIHINVCCLFSYAGFPRRKLLIVEVSLNAFILSESFHPLCLNPSESFQQPTRKGKYPVWIMYAKPHQLNQAYKNF